mmetsp:Transcript_107963/g.191186  ORF Transcript_107963/g.191186 Transcript_107963/m.191186 type:complete len:234 (-) Transcript_107963:66-767(-)
MALLRTSRPPQLVMMIFLWFVCPAAAWRLPASQTSHNVRMGTSVFETSEAMKLKRLLMTVNDMHTRDELVQLLEGELARALQKSETKLRQANVAEVSMETYLHSASLPDKAERLSSWAELVLANLAQIPAGAQVAIVHNKEGKLVNLEFNTAEFGSPQEEAEDALAKAQRVRRTKSRVDGLRLHTEATLETLRGWQRRVTAAQNDLQTLRVLHLEMLESAKELGMRPAVLRPV